MEEEKSRYKIFDLNNNLLVDDIAMHFKYRKLMNPLNGEGVLISFDDNYFFNLNAKELVYKKIDDKDDFKRIKFDINNFTKYKMDMWHKICFDGELINDEVVIYKDNDITELDPEVKDLVNAINKLPCTITFSSCSGHGEKSMFVGMGTSSIAILEILSKIIYDNFNQVFYLTTEPGYTQKGIGRAINFNLTTHLVGEKAYKKVQELCCKIEEYVSKNLKNDYKKINELSSETIMETYDDEDNIRKEISILKNTLKNIAWIYLDEENKNANIYREIHLVFYDIKTLKDFLIVLWNGFKNDFVIRTNNNIMYVNNNGERFGISLTLEFVMDKKEIANKVKALNKALLDSITDWKNLNDDN